MKYYIVDEPYFALIKADDKSEAVELYEKYVADDEDGSLVGSLEEISRDKALALVSRCLTEDGELRDVEDVIRYIEDSKSSVLLIDGNLL